MAATAPHIRSTWNATIRTILGGALIVSLVLLAFVWPTAKSSVHNLPVAVVGSGAQADAVREKLEGSGNFRVTTRADRADAVNGIEARQIYGAVVLPSGTDAKPEMLTSSAASPVVAQMLTGMAGQLNQNIAQQTGAAKQQAAQGAAEAGAQAAAAQASLRTLQETQAQLPEASRAGLQPAIAQAQQRAQAAGEKAAAAKQAVDAINAPVITTTDVVPLSADDPRGTGLRSQPCRLPWAGCSAVC